MSMTVEDFFQRLAYGQLKNTSATDDAAGGLIMPEHELQLLQLAEQGMVDIFTRKKLLEGRNIITLVEGQNDLYLDPTDPDWERMVKVLEFITGDERGHTPRTNKHIFQSDEHNFRFSDTFIQHYLEREQPEVEVRFQKLHPIIDDRAVFQMPKHLEEALILYVSGLYLSHMGGEEHSKKGDSYYGLYLKMMMDDDIENRSGTSEVVQDDTKFEDRGFV
jgi:hypothetical protein